MTDIALLPPGDPGYAAATRPENASAHQAPALVAAPHDAAGVAAAVLEASRRGLRALPQATGHGAGGETGDDVLLISTAGLDTLDIDADTRIASAGVGRRWGGIQGEAERSGLLGLSGSSPSVAIAGYTFGGGIGWLARPHGLAAAALRSVEFVDGAGTIRTAADDATEAADRDAMWAFRGGGGVGVATRLTFDLVPVPDLHAGYLLWPVAHLDAVVAAWAAATGEVADDVSSSIAVLHVPPQGPFPDDLLGTVVVHLAVAASAGEAGALPLLRRVRAAATPAVDTWGPADAEKLGGIHLDPRAATPALGDARWLGEDAPDHVAAMLGASVDSPLAMVEVRQVGNAAAARDGASATAVGPYLLHGVAPVPKPELRPAADAALAAVRAEAAPVDAGRSPGSWMEGRTSVPDALPPDVRARVAAIADAVDPARTIVRSRFLA